MLRAFVAALMLALSAPAFAGFESQEQLARQIEALGAFESATDRHAIEIHDCEMTTYVWRDWPPHGKDFFSSFAFNIAILLPPDATRPIEEFYFENMDAKIDDGNISLVQFRTRPGTSARHEVAGRRNIKTATTPSPRKGPDEYFYKESTQFYYIHVGAQKPGRAHAFVEALYRYQREFCLPIG